MQERVDHRHEDEHHRSQRSGWLRAGVLGANDGLLSTASLLIGVAAGDATRSVLWLTGFASLAAGAFSMAAGEYSSVSSQRDAEVADLRMEAEALEANPNAEINELAGIYRRRGLSPELAREVALALHQGDALAAHAHDELGLDPDALSAPVLAAVVSAASFVLGALVPVLAMGLLSHRLRVPVTAVITLVALGCLGVFGARAGGARRVPALIRLVVLGGLAMGVTSLIGRAVGSGV
jgi:VIT1/CCC1 family predicted Fe2+/Mn2+ transporter